ncbi:DUF305 domain-containing protein [Streptomyces sp. NPDC001914]|uniref:DUF305 domain-containing protein n=1 Tax=Streptomyces sp. NPDC001914 TaxID=3364623 RepID=UPI0036C6CBDA
MTAFTRAPRRGSARRFTAVGVVVAGALLLSACGGDGDDTADTNHGSGHGRATGTAKPTATATGTAGVHNAADVQFAQMMIPHHEQAVEMAELADGRASDPEIRSLATKIKKAQDPEIRTMTGWLRSWGAPAAMGDMPGMDMGDGMMSDKDMTELKAMKGSKFDKMFAQMMIGHHNGAISMAKDERESGRYTGTVKMAGAIVTGQSAEVEQLRGILDRL